MALENILDILKNDNLLNTLLSATEEDTRIYPFASPKVCDCIVYNFTPLKSDGIKGIAQFKATIITQDMALNLAIQERLDELLLTLADNLLIANITNCTRSGGGTLYNAEVDTIHTIAHYAITYRR